MLQRSLAAIVRPVSYCYGLPFVFSVVLAILIVGRVGWGRHHSSIWSFALAAFVATTFALLCGGRFRTLYVAIAVVPQFLVVLQWFIKVRPWLPDAPIKPVAEFFLYFVAAPILVVWLAATLLNRKERHA